MLSKRVRSPNRPSGTCSNWWIGNGRQTCKRSVVWGEGGVRRSQIHTVPLRQFQHGRCSPGRTSGTLVQKHVPRGVLSGAVAYVYPGGPLASQKRTLQKCPSPSLVESEGTVSPAFSSCCAHLVEGIVSAFSQGTDNKARDGLGLEGEFPGDLGQPFGASMIFILAAVSISDVMVSRAFLRAFPRAKVGLLKFQNWGLVLKMDFCS